MDRVSIITPSYNGEKYLADTIKSVQAQTFQNWELIVVDDGSTDQSAALACAFAADDNRIRLVRQANGGESAARNTGLRESDPQADYVIFLDQDDVWETDALETLLDALNAHPDAIGAHAIGQFVDPEGQPCLEGHLESWCRSRKRLQGKRFVDCAPADPTTLETFAYHPTIPTPGVCLLHRDRLPPGDLFKPEMRTGSGDIHLWMRLARSGHFVFVDKSIIRGRRHAANMTNNRKLIVASMDFAYRDLMQMQDTTPQQRALLDLGYRSAWHDRAKSDARSAVLALRKGSIAEAIKNAGRALRDNYRYVRGMSP